MCWEFPTKKEQAEEFQNRINMRAVTMNIVEINKKVMNNLIVFLGSHSSKLLKFAKYDKTFVYQRGGKEKKWGNMTEDEWYQYRIDFLQDPDETEVGTLPLPPSTIEGWFNNDRTQENILTESKQKSRCILEHLIGPGVALTTQKQSSEA